MVHRFLKSKSKNRLDIETRAELMYMCKADASHTRLPRAMHMHDDRVEIVFILEGSGTHIVGGRAYKTKRGDLLVYNSGILHDESSNPDVDMSVYCCAFKNLKIKGLAKNCLSREQEGVVFHTRELYPTFERLLDMLHSQIGVEDRYASELCEHLLQALIVLARRLIEDSESDAESRGYDLGVHIKNYIDQHYLESIDLKSMSERLRISPYYLAHKFKSSIGCSPIRYLIRRRIGEAQSLLINTKLSVTEIATMVGYDNSNYFNTAFKKIVGITPNSYRKQSTK